MTDVEALEVARVLHEYPTVVKQRDELVAEVSRLRALFDDAGQGEHNVLALVDHYQRESIEAADRLRATCRKRDELVEVVRELVEALDMAAHSEECSRTEECDELEPGEECGIHDACPSCDCGVDRWQASATKARAVLVLVLAKWGGK
jgi:uncharacterized coiled-coil DUF342 family protein